MSQPDEKLKQAEAFLREFLEKEGLELSYTMQFPVYRILPDEVKLALAVLSKHGMKIVATMKRKEKPSE